MEQAQLTKDERTNERLAELDRLVAMSRDELLLERLEEIATGVGRLRRRAVAAEKELDVWALDGIAGAIMGAAAMLEPTAGQLVKWWAPGQDDAATEALRLVDARENRWRRRLCLEARP